MADTIRTVTEVLALFADNTTGGISAQDLRDFVVSIGFNTRTTVNVATYDVVEDDRVLHVTRSAAGVCAIDLKTAQLGKNRILDVKDAGGNAFVNNITITTEGAETIDGAANLVIDRDYQSYTIYDDGSNYFIK